jgi:diguanylate cyclase (GGDEF)-like protein
MDEHADQLGTEDLAAARELTRRGMRGTTSGLVAFVGLASALAGGIVALLLDDAGVLLTAAACGVAGAVVGLPLVLSIARYAARRGNQMSIETIVRERALESDGRRREFETRLSRALEMSDDEDSAFDVLGRAMQAVAPDSPVELLLADNSHAHLERVVTAAPEGQEGPGCAVGSPDSCVAARRAQTQSFADSDDLDACPMLRGRAVGRCSGLCVPVSIMGRTVGVLHTTGDPGDAFSDDDVQAFQTLANQAGNRLGMLRVMAESQLQASTDGLTGLINRRSLENAMRRLREDGSGFSFVMADLDHFKDLNDSHGHETGDRALRIFSETLRNAMRTDDLACRYGGEEFAIVLPGADIGEAVEVIERVRESLAQATGRGDAPAFSASFGIAYSGDAADLDDLVQRADRAMFAAKAAGRDRICLDGHAQAVAPSLTALSS